MAEPVLVGRESELKELQLLLDSVIKGKGSTVFISGEAGSGKSRLTSEFLKIAKKKGIPVLTGSCLSDVAVPYLPFVEAFNSFFGSFGQEEEPGSLRKPATQLGLTGNTQSLSNESGITAWLTRQRPVGKSGESQMLSPQVWQDQVFDSVVKTFHAISAQQPIVFFVEDIHWADSASLALFHYVARAINNSEKVLVLATFRGEELTADAEGHPHPLAETLLSMKRENLFTEIKLTNLDHTATRKIAENMIGGKLQPSFAEKLAKESQGNPLFIVESLRMLSDRKSLVKENDEWRLAVEELGIPSRVRDIILQRLAILRFDQRKVLDAASVIGEKFDVELLSTVLGLDTLEVLETLNVIAHSTSLVGVEENCYRFDHAKSRETLYEELSPPLRRGYHARVAERLETTSRDGRLSFSEIAYHYAQAGNKEKAVKNAMSAGQDALGRFSNAEAIKHFTYVLQNAPDSIDSADKKRIALEGLGDAYFANCMFLKAQEVFERLADSESGKLKLRALRKAMDSVFFGKKDPAHLMELARKAEPYATCDRLENARVKFQGARGSIHEITLEQYSSILKEWEVTLQVFEEEYSLPDVARALEALGGTESMFLNQKGLGFSERAIALFNELGDSRGQLRAIYFAASSYLVFGLVQEGKEKLRQVVHFGEKLGDYDKIARACMMLSRILETEGCFEEALAQTLKGMEYFEETDAPRPQDLNYSSLVREHAEIGDLRQAEEYLVKLVNLPPEAREPEIRGRLMPGSHEYASISAFSFARAHAVFLTAKNRWAEAKQYFRKALDIAQYIGFMRSFSEVMVRSDLVWALNKQGQPEEAKTQLEEIQKIYAEIEERFAHVNIQANLMAPRKVVAGEEFEIRLDLVNISRKPGLLVKVENLIPIEFKLATLPFGSSLNNGSVDMKERTIKAFQVETLKLRLKPTKAGVFNLNTQVTYIDERGDKITCKSNPVTITVQPQQPKYEVLPGRIATGLDELDGLLFGGIPEQYAVALTSPSIDERELLVNKFLETGAMAGEIVFNVTAEAAIAKVLAEKYPSNFYLFICNPQADAIIRDLPNVSKLKGVENLTDIDVALTKAFRTLSPSMTGTRRICIDIVSDVLLQHHAVTTRRWLSALLPSLKSKGFTVLAVIDPGMHPTEETQAVLGLFDGEINIHEKETPKGTARFLKIKKMTGQKYLKDETPLTRE